MTTLVIGGDEPEKGRERTWWVRTRLGAKPASFLAATEFQARQKYMHSNSFSEQYDKDCKI